MAKIAQLDPPARAWARDLFARYYRTAEIPAPERFARREFAAFPFAAETLMRRHASFRSEPQLREFLAREVPRHVYYSSAYYKHPDHPQMSGKEWLGADLIFDLDADHLRGAERLDYPGQLALVKQRLVALLDDFLTRDFGIAPDSMEIVFSGGRGYHVHVRDERFLVLSSPERRELVEYVMGIGFDAATAVDQRREEASSAMSLVAEEEGVEPARRRRAAPAYKRLAPVDTPGWRGRTTRSVLQLLERWEGLGPKRAAEEIVAAGVAPPIARSLARSLLDRGRAARIRSSLSLDVFPRDVPPELLSFVLTRAAIEVQGETDAPVTTDIHRLIRLPGSLHGGTGFRVVSLPREALDAFEPLRDAPVPMPAGEMASVELTEDVDASVASGSVRGAAGERALLPTPLAAFLVLRGQATLRA